MIAEMFKGKKQETEFEMSQNDEYEKHLNHMAAESTPEEQYMSAAAMPTPDLTRWQQDNDPYVQKLILKLKRQYVDDDGKTHQIQLKKYTIGGKFVYEDMEPLCSDECCENIIAILQSNTSPNTILSKFSEEQISNMETQLEYTLIIDVLLPERKKYNTPLAYMSQTKKIFRSFIKPTLYRAYKGFENNNQRQIRTVKELHTDSNRNISSKGDKYNMFNSD